MNSGDPDKFFNRLPTKPPKQVLLESEMDMITIDDCIEIAFGSDSVAEIRRKAAKALRNGAVVKWGDGSEQWIQHEAIMDTSKPGSEMFIWDKAGNKVKHKIRLFTKINGSETSETIGTTFRVF